MATIVDLAEAVKNSLAAGTYSVPIEVARVYDLGWDVPTLDTVSVQVAPLRETGERLNRSTNLLIEAEIVVGVCARLPSEAASTEVIDPMMTLAHSLAYHFLATPLTAVNAVWTKTEFIVYPDIDMLSGELAFLAGWVLFFNEGR